MIRRFSALLAALALASGVSAQTVQTGSVTGHTLEPSTIYNQSCNSGAGGIVGQTYSATLCTLNTTSSGGSVSGTVAIDQSVPGTTNAVSVTNASIPVTGAFYPATQPVSGTVTAAQATASSLNATVVGAGTAGTPSGGVVTVQGITNGTALPVSGTFYQATQPVSLATLPALTAGSAAIGSITNTSFAATQATASSLNAQVVGDSAAAATDSGSNPLKIGGVARDQYGSAITAGQRGNLTLTTSSELQVTLGFPGAGFIAASFPNSDGLGATNLQLNTQSLGYAYNNSGFDRLRTAPGAAATGNAGLGVLAVEEAGRTFVRMSTATTTTIKSGKGFLHTVNVGTCVSGATITMYDNTAGSGTIIDVITCPANTAGMPTFVYDIAFATGLTATTSGATSVNFSYR